MIAHKNTFLKIEDLGSIIPPYQPNFQFDGRYIDSEHQYYAECPVIDNGVLIQIKTKRVLGGRIIEGWLRREDALKLYEMAYFARGDILELGPFHGLSTSILAVATMRSPHKKTIFTVDLNPECINTTRENLRSRKLLEYVKAQTSEATAAIKEFAMESKRFSFVFIDHSHAYDPVYSVCRELGNIVVEGGFCLFHDFNDERNRDPNDKDYGVYQAVQDGLDSEKFEFYGIYGCCGLYRAL